MIGEKSAVSQLASTDGVLTVEEMSKPLAPREPSLHKSVPIGARVRVPSHYLGHAAVGTVVGISSVHIIFFYIVLMDEPFPSEYGECRALTVSGSELDSEDGKTNWRLDQ